MKGANPGNQLPKVINMELTSQMMSRAKLADYFESKAMAQLGISQQLMGDVNATDTATGIKAATSQSQLNVQRYYTDFFEYKQRCLTMSLDIAQYVQAKKKDVTIMYTKSDASREFIRLVGTDLLLRNMHVYVVNSQELLRQMETIRSLFINNNTTNASALDLVEIITANSPAALKVKLAEVMQKQESQQQELMNQQQQAQQQQVQIAQMKEQKLDERLDKSNYTKVEVAEILAHSKTKSQLPSENTNTPNALDYAKFNTQSQNDQAKIDTQSDSNTIKREKLSQDKTLKAKELEIREKQLKERARESRNKVRIAKVNNK